MSNSSFMKQISKIVECLTVILSFLFLHSCTDDTAGLGLDMMPASDTVRVFYDTYPVPTETFSVDEAVLARTSRSYLGRFTDPETGISASADFITQYHITESSTGNLFPPKIVNDSITSIDVRLYIDDFIGDSLTTFKVSVYDLDTDLDPEADYYTDINPNDYIDETSEPMSFKWFTLSDRILSEADRTATGYVRHIRIPLPREIGQAIYDSYKEDKSDFTSTYKWLHSGLPCSKGLYFKLEYGEGAVAYVYITQIRINYRYYDDTLKKEVDGVTLMSSTEEVIEVTNFQTEDLDPLVSDPTCTYLRTPAGLFTQLTLPIESISTTDTINSASIQFKRYNDTSDEKYKLGIPQTLLLVRLDEYNNGFFEKYRVADNKTSYITTFSATGNTYTFSNIAQLINKCIKEKKSGKASANYNKVLLIPVTTTYDTSKNLVKLNHDFSFNQARLVKNTSLNIIYSRFGSAEENDNDDEATGGSK